MELSPQDRSDLIAKAADILVDRLLERTNPDELIRLPVTVACQLSGKRQRQLSRLCHIIREGQREHYITLAEYKAKLLPTPNATETCLSE